MNNNILIFVNIGRSCSSYQVLTHLDNSLSLDHTQKWVDIHQHVSQNTMLAIDRVIGNRIVYNQTELKYVLQQLHLYLPPILMGMGESQLPSHPKSHHPIPF